MIKHISTIIFLILFYNFINAQIIVVDPPFPTDQDEVTVTFNAQEGSGGLAGYDGTVYAHTGVITDKSQSGSDWRYVKADWGVNIPDCKMVPVGEDLWQLTIGPSIRDYYGVPAGEIILKMAFVFRSATEVDGAWLEGKTESGGDIFYDVSEIPASRFASPPRKNLLL